jgi:hypothetical protein
MMEFGTDVPHHCSIPSFQWLAPCLAVPEGRVKGLGCEFAYEGKADREDGIAEKRTTSQG